MSALRTFITDEIRTRGPIPFSRYMHLCLYGGPDGAPPGYYSADRQVFGKAGDFYTSSDVHALFGRLLSRQFEQMWRALDSPERIELLEVGPGRGLFAQDVLDWSAEKFPHFHRALRYTLLEISPGLRRRLDERFSEQIAAGKLQVLGSTAEILEPLEHAIVFANELFDALPVEVVSDQGQVFVDVRDARFVDVFRPASPEVLKYLDRYSVHPHEGERVEACTVAEEVLRQIAAVVRRGFLVFIDYGYTRDEQLQGRHLDTLLTYRQHTASADPYAMPGEQDITAHVNFTALADFARQSGLETFPLVTQSQFLVGIGEETQFADAFAGCTLPQEHAKVALQLKHIATPAGMGDFFHVLALARGVEKGKAAQLDGLKFAREISSRQ
ncbi:MAG: class I SAM-dependent methyltransferase [Terriglobales bacterium]